MSSRWVTYRTIVEEELATQSIDKLTEKYERFEEQWEGFKWFLSRAPEESSPKHSENGEIYHLMHRGGDIDCDLIEISAVCIYLRRKRGHAD